MAAPLASDPITDEAERLAQLPKELEQVINMPKKVERLVEEPKGEIKAEVKAETKDDKIIILFPNGISGHLQPRSYVEYSRGKHGHDFKKKAEEMRNRFQGIEVFDVPPIARGTQSDGVVI